MTAQFTTIGHSNRQIYEFLDMLREAGVALLVDVRSFPRSRTNPVYNIESLPEDLADMQIGYRHFSALGGRRSKQSDVDENVNAMWRVQSFHNYAEYALSEEFDEAFNAMLDVGRDKRVALMCSEAVWWRCHRRIITDYLLLNGYAVDHLMSPGHIDPAILTPGARKTAEGKAVYPSPAA